jgi:hypothetical protein
MRSIGAAMVFELTAAMPESMKFSMNESGDAAPPPPQFAIPGMIPGREEKSAHVFCIS